MLAGYLPLLTRTASLGLLVALSWSPRLALGQTDTNSSKAGAPGSSSVELTQLDLSDFRGRVWHLEDFRDREVLVVTFIGVECPLAKFYSNRLVELQAQYAQASVAFIAVDANPQDSLTEMAAHARRHKLEFPFVRDSQQHVARALAATRTPEAFVLDRQRRVRYQGRIDDQYGIGYVREQPQTSPLRDAIDSVLKGEQVLVPAEAATGCLIGKLKQDSSAQQASVTYAEHIAPIFRDACVQCHRAGEIAPFALTDYQEIVGWAETIAEVVSQRRMPPWHADPKVGDFANDCSLSANQRELIVKWVEQGAAEGDPKLLPEPRQYVEGWQLPHEPDLVLNINSQPFAVPATGEVRYQYFRVDPGFREDKWVSAAQVLPGNHSVVHHILVFARPAGSRGSLGSERGFLFGYVPGAVVQPFPAGAAKRIPAGSELVFQVHYTPTGTPQFDQSRLGLLFADADAITHEVITTSAVQTRLSIPPHANDHKVSAMLPEELPDSQLLGMSPHMHLRGKSFRYTLVAKDGSRDILLDVPKYDFNWQTGYRLSQPRQLSAGSRIFCEAIFDNSAENLNNPDPSARVHWGDQTSDEMMIGYFDILVPRGQAARGSGTPSRSSLIERIKSLDLLKKLDSDNNGKIERSEVPYRWQNQFDLLDRNSDGVISPNELD